MIYFYTPYRCNRIYKSVKRSEKKKSLYVIYKIYRNKERIQQNIYIFVNITKKREEKRSKLCNFTSQAKGGS